ncbi:MAG TPA: hypothetical protein VIO80_15920 [Candidatus Dormibacteraeota bacterium]|jgi:hypothetical protein
MATEEEIEAAKAALIEAATASFDYQQWVAVHGDIIGKATARREMARLQQEELAAFVLYSDLAGWPVSLTSRRHAARRS